MTAAPLLDQRHEAKVQAMEDHDEISRSVSDMNFAL
jgi:hypothetical protein